MYKVMTVRLNAKVAQEFDARLKDLKLRRDEYLRDQLEREVESLERINANSASVVNYLQQKKMGRFSDRLKVGLKLPAQLIERISRVCAEKNVPRDLFIESFLDFLTNGWPEQGVASPLAMALEYLRDPYWDVDGALNLYEQRCSLSEKQIRLLKELEDL